MRGNHPVSDVIFRIAPLVLAMVLILSAEASADPVLNEIMPSNTAGLKDEDGDRPDWIELYNPAVTEISLAGYGLTDDPATPLKWVFPAASIPPKGTVVVFASGKDRTTTILHTNFKISAGGETIMLTTPQGAIVDSITTGELEENLSVGRYPDGMGAWILCGVPTPGAANSNSATQGYVDSVQVSVAPGFFTAPVTVILSTTTSGASIRYTTDGSIPTEASTLYTAPKTISVATVLRVRAFKTGWMPSPLTTASYLIGHTGTLPVVSLSSDPGGLFNADYGMYVLGKNASTDVPFFGANFWEDWELPVHIEFFEPTGMIGFSIDAGTSIGGGWSRRYPRKSLIVSARGSYGPTKIDYPVFPGLPFTSYNSIMLRNSGNDWGSTVFRDAFVTSLIRDMNVDIRNYRMAVVYINGQYWGVHDIRERMNEEYLQAHYGIEPDNLDILEIEYRDSSHEVVRAGDDTHYRALESYLASNSMAFKANYDSACALMDVDNFIDYLTTIIYVANYDWGANNVKWWRPKTPEGRWRWLSYDNDRGFALKKDDDYNHNTVTTVMNSTTGKNILQKLLVNAQFKKAFINRIADCLNTRFQPTPVKARIDEFRSLLEPEMVRHIPRWDDPYYENVKEISTPFYLASMDEWKTNISVMKTFADLRPAIVRNHLNSQFSLGGSGTITLAVEPEGAGIIKINSVVPENYPWTGTYFRAISVTVTAVARSGYVFSGWSGIARDSRNSIDITVPSSGTVTALFTPDAQAVQTLVINEINYNGLKDSDPDDWVELLNPHTFPVDASGWVLRDDNDANGFTLPAATVVSAGGYLVLCRTAADFHTIFPSVVTVTGDVSFGFAGSGGGVRLFNASGALVDSLTYDDTDPWPVEPDGKGPTLALRDSALDNALPGSWAASSGFGTPGRANEYTVMIEEPASPSVFALGSNYPNPFNPSTMLTFTLPEPGRITLTVYSVTGQVVAHFADSYYEAGNHEINWNGCDDAGNPVSSGLYLVRLTQGARVSVGKITLLR